MASSEQSSPSVTELVARGVPINEHQAAELLGVSVAFLREDRVTRRHGVPYLKIGKTVRYRPAALLEWLERCAVPQAQGQT